MASLAAEQKSYTLTWVVLIVCTLLSLAFAHVFGHGPTLAFAVFSVAAFKASLVARNFMHLKAEPLFIGVIALTGLAIVVLILVGMIPDIVFQFGRMSP